MERRTRYDLKKAQERAHLLEGLLIAQDNIDEVIKIIRSRYEDAKEAAKRYENIFGKDNFFLELQDHGMQEQGMVNQQLLRLSQDTGIELVATNDVHYTYADDEKPHDVLLCIQTGKKLAV